MRLTVKPLKNREPGSGMAVIDREVLGDFDVGSGDFVAIEGRDGSRAVAQVWPSDAADAGSGVIRIDGQLRRAAGVGIDDPVTVESTEVAPAEKITIALPESIGGRGDLAAHVREQLIDRAVTAGQTVAVPLGFGLFSGQSGRRVPIRIVDTDPSGTVVVQGSTTVEVADSDATVGAATRPNPTRSSLPPSPTRTSGGSTTNSGRSGR